MNAHDDEIGAIVRRSAQNLHLPTIRHRQRLHGSRDGESANASEWTPGAAVRARQDLCVIAHVPWH